MTGRWFRCLAFPATLAGLALASCSHGDSSTARGSDAGKGGDGAAVDAADATADAAVTPSEAGADGQGARDIGGNVS